jgi:hypothetical protein
MAARLAAFGRFWYSFIVGDDWVIAAAVALSLVADYALLRAGYHVWWLVPVAVIAVMTYSLWRARDKPA